VTDILTRLDVAIGGPDRRTKTGRVRKLTPLKVETALLVDAKAHITRLRELVTCFSDAVRLAEEGAPVPITYLKQLLNRNINDA
jgi:hypothetical protein